MGARLGVGFGFGRGGSFLFAGFFRSRGGATPQQTKTDQKADGDEQREHGVGRPFRDPIRTRGRLGSWRGDDVIVLLVFVLFLVFLLVFAAFRRRLFLFGILVVFVFVLFLVLRNRRGGFQFRWRGCFCGLGRHADRRDSGVADDGGGRRGLRLQHRFRRFAHQSLIVVTPFAVNLVRRGRGLGNNPLLIFVAHLSLL